jgi:hypothetical protein
LLDGKKVSNPDQSIELYELCKTFHKLPSEILAEDADDIMLLLIVHNAVNSHQAESGDKAGKKSRRDDLKAKRQRGEI